MGGFTLGLATALIWIATRQRLPDAVHCFFIVAGLAGVAVVLIACRRRFADKARQQLLSAIVSVAIAFVSGSGFGFVRGITSAKQAVGEILAQPLQDTDITLRGTLLSIPKVTAHSKRFQLLVQTPRANGHALPRKISLNWYTTAKSRAPVLVPGDYWQMTVRLKRIHGSSTPGVFDIEAWSFRRGIGARGYVKSGYRLHRGHRGFTQAITFARWRLQQYIEGRIESRTTAGLLTALAVGDRSALDDNDWRTLRRTGTSHLMAISGLHVGLAALWSGFVIGVGWRRSRRLMQWRAVIQAQAVAAIIAGAGYALLAGLAIPTQRALIMLAIFAGARLLARRVTLHHNLLLALMIVLCVDPLAINEPGLWLSFTAVIMLGVVLPAGAGHPRRSTENDPIIRRAGMVIYQWFRLQWLLTIALAPVLLLLFQQLSLVSVPANLLAIPITGFIIVPLVLIGVILFLLGIEVLSGPVFDLAAFVMQALWSMLELLASVPLATWERATPSPWVLLLALTGLFALLLPRGFYGRGGLLLAWLPLMFGAESDLADGELEVAILDVGQGLAIVVRDGERALVFDTGLKYRSGGSAAASIIVPYLRARGVRRLQRIIISHPDNDHAGGASDLTQAFPPEHLHTGPEVQASDAQVCKRGDQWRWRHTHFQFLSPGDRQHQLRGNNASCVLLIRHGETSVLLTGDIEARAERVLVANYGDGLKSDVLVLGHHGSRTSSTADFLSAVSPKVGVASAGYRNRHGHPALEVVERLAGRGISLERTDRSGTIVFRINHTGYKLLRYRHILNRYWHHT